jgi:prolyl-tRNA synthetase
VSQPSQEGITVKKSEDFDEWYTQVMLKGEIADYSPVSGCIVLRPNGYAIWEAVRSATDAEFKKIGVQNTYFPLFIPERLLKKEQEHVKGFSPEVAWVTEAGQSKLDERLAVRPTSETLMYEVASRWVRSWRDLPMKLNQWNNVVRWEFRHPTPLLRTREFLWNEGHSMFATKAEADAERDTILGIYRMITEEFLALPGYVGRKSDSEKFAGAEASYSIEHLLPDGKAIQGPDFHSDGQRFAVAFEISFIDEKGQRQNVWQNTWAITTREVGVMLAVHGDDKGAVIPPRVAGTQVVVVPIGKSTDKEVVNREAKSLADRLSSRFRTRLDDRDHLTPGWKFNEWELKGVPLRVELGPRDIQAGQAVLVSRDSGAKRAVKAVVALDEVGAELDAIQSRLLAKARDALARNTHMADSLDGLKKLISDKGGIVRAPWCGSPECEEELKKETGAKIVNIPLGQHDAKSHCVRCGKDASTLANFARSY